MSKMIKFKGVLDGFRSAPPTKPEEEVIETLKPDNFQIAKTFLHGFPHQPSAVAFDPIQRLLAIGTKNGSLRILGRPGVDSQVRHETEVAVLQIDFLLNEGALITATSDDSLHLWNFRQKRPEIVHSLKFQKERITCMFLPVKSKWLYVGSERGNIHVVNVESFALSGYVINWNKAIDVINTKHPGPVVHLSDCPNDENKLLIGYETGQVVLWNLRTKKAELRWQSTEALKSITWHYEGKQFMCAHVDGTLTTWNLRPQDKPSSVIAPHSKINKDGKVDPACKPIQKVEWKTSKTGDAFIIFSGGTTYDTASRMPSLTVMHGKSTTVLEMEHNIVDFITLCESPYVTDIQEPYAIVILLQYDLVLIDVQTLGFPSFENPYPMDIHESPVTCCSYFADCPSDIIPAFYSVGRATQKRSGFSDKDWPIAGGEWSPTSCSYNEIIITGHADGSIKFWDASAGTLQVLYKLKTAKIFEKPQSRSIDGNEVDPFSIQLISLCPESRKLAIAGASSYVILFKFRKLESTSEVSVLEIPTLSCTDVEPDCSPDFDFPPRGSITKNESESSEKKVIESTFPVKVKSAPQKKPPGFQAHLVCLTAFAPTEPVFQMTSLALNSSYGLLAYGSENGVVLVDFVQKCCLLNIASSDLYGNSDPFQRAPRSPKRNPASAEASDGERCRSPSIDQMNGVCVSPTSIWQGFGSPVRGIRQTDPVRRSKSQDKLDSSFSRSRSSSMSSLENISSESIRCLAFSDSYIKKSDAMTVPTLWIGTSLGSVFYFTANIPSAGETRSSQPIALSTVGSLPRLKSGILTISFLDCNGSLLRYSYEQWKDESKEKKTPTKNNPTSTTLSGSIESVSCGGSAPCDKQFVVVVSEKQARVSALPSHECVYKQQLADTDFVVKAEVILLKDSVCLLCYISNSHIVAYGLPSLKPLIDVDFLPLSDLSFQTRKQGIVDPMLSIWGQQMFVNEDTNQIAKTFCFSNRGHGLYFSSPSEVQKFTVSSDFCRDMSELVGELFLPRDMPEPPKQSLFKSLLGGGARSVDREELFGESSGKPIRSIAKHIPGPSGQLEQLNQRVQHSTGEVGRAHRLMVERGDKLGQLEENTQRMMNDAEKFASSAHELMQKSKDKKWYQL
ncbi:syntaxin-binding protein 5 isoform X5 [Planococcus citri]|uniref:syntaxin-binding protein 5 isoform X5 n=1 Tax=Planococcus citri TaxID=170843 RepID=UPI0031F79DA5